MSNLHPDFTKGLETNIKTFLEEFATLEQLDRDANFPAQAPAVATEFLKPTSDEDVIFCQKVGSDPEARKRLIQLLADARETCVLRCLPRIHKKIFEAKAAHFAKLAGQARKEEAALSEKYEVGPFSPIADFFDGLAAKATATAEAGFTKWNNANPARLIEDAARPF